MQTHLTDKDCIRMWLETSTAKQCRQQSSQTVWQAECGFVKHSCAVQAPKGAQMPPNAPDSGPSVKQHLDGVTRNLAHAQLFTTILIDDQI